MATAGQSITDIAELDVDLPKLSNAAEWLSLDDKLLSASEYVFQNNIAAIADRQDMYYQLALNKFLNYQSTTISGRRSSVSAVSESEASVAPSRAEVVPPDEVLEGSIEQQWTLLRGVLAQFESSGHVVYMRRSKKSISAARSFLAFLKQHVTNSEDPLFDICTKLETIEEPAQHGFFLHIGMKYKGKPQKDKGSKKMTSAANAGTKGAKALKRRRPVEDDTEEHEEQEEQDSDDDGSSVFVARGGTVDSDEDGPVDGDAVF